MNKLEEFPFNAQGSLWRRTAMAEYSNVEEASLETLQAKGTGIDLAQVLGAGTSIIILRPVQAKVKSLQRGAQPNKDLSLYFEALVNGKLQKIPTQVFLSAPAINTIIQEDTRKKVMDAMNADDVWTPSTDAAAFMAQFQGKVATVKHSFIGVEGEFNKEAARPELGKITRKFNITLLAKAVTDPA